ncbi:MAG: hypothetical protein J7K66_06775 [Anaerolineaceae bacterium]|nr:hypothetical protein [Anaerolineaceae bacterium]
MVPPCLAEISPLGPIANKHKQLDALVSLRVRSGLVACTFTRSAREGTSSGFTLAGSQSAPLLSCRDSPDYFSPSMHIRSIGPIIP